MTTSKKKIIAPNAATKLMADASSTTRVVAPPPTTPAPSPPADEGQAQQQNLRKGVRPLRVHLVGAAPAVAELRAATTFASDFGSLGTQAGALATNLERAASWRAARVQSRAWDRYVASGDSTAWSTLLQQLEVFQPAFEHALLVDPTVAQRYPALTALLGARKTPAAKSVATRRKNAAKKTATPPPAK